VSKPDFDRNDPEGRQLAKNFLLCVLAGNAAESLLDERLFNIEELSTQEDYLIANIWATRLLDDLDERKAFIEQRWRDAREFVSDPLRRSQIALVGNRLKDGVELSHDQIASLMERMKASHEVSN
jgi:hypothetical protein